MNILLVDFNDSFTAILKQSVEKAGSQNVDVANILEIKNFASIENYNGIILGPGPGYVDEYPGAFELLDRVENKIPVLGICLGLQIIAVKYGGTLKNLGKVFHGKKCEIRHLSNSFLFDGISETFYAGLYHSWAVDYPGNELEVSSFRTSDNVIMSLKHKSFAIEGLQFHPESFMTELGIRILSNWIEYLQ